ncbi:MAG: hypothetical protein GX601_19645 [Anaerolineales bacterium]|nr:hypothetical protein [Anaerolineales bacterium]
MPVQVCTALSMPGFESVRYGPERCSPIYSWAYEMRVEDPDGHVRRFGSDPKPGLLFADS